MSEIDLVRTKQYIVWCLNRYIECLVEMKRIAREAGVMVRKAFKEEKSVMIKNGDTTDLVTETDRAVEQFVVEQLKAFQPDWL